MLFIAYVMDRIAHTQCLDAALSLHVAHSVLCASEWVSCTKTAELIEMSSGDKLV